MGATSFKKLHFKRKVTEWLVIWIILKKTKHVFSALFTSNKIWPYSRIVKPQKRFNQGEGIKDKGQKACVVLKWTKVQSHNALGLLQGHWSFEGRVILTFNYKKSVSRNVSANWERYNTVWEL